MALPSLTSLLPVSGPASGGDLVRLTGSGFSESLRVTFGGAAGTLILVRDEGALSIATVRTPAHEPGWVDVELQNLGPDGTPIAGERILIPKGYRFTRTSLAKEADLTRLVRQLLRELKRQVLPNVTVSVSVDAADPSDESPRTLALARLPALVLSGPTLRKSRFYSTNVAFDDVVPGTGGLELTRRHPSATVDLGFTITAASERAAEIFNLMAAVATFLSRNPWLELPRDPDDPARGRVRWELEAEGDTRSQPSNRDGLHAFTAGLVVRGFDIDEGLPRDLGRLVTDLDFDITPLDEGAAP